MKQLALFIMCLFAAACQIQVLEGDIYPQNEIISSINRGSKGIWMGFENGTISQFIPGAAKTETIKVADNWRIYSIIEIKENLLLVGIRNQGLKLIALEGNSARTIKSYRIDEKEDEYSPYSFIIKKGRENVDTLICGSSNGLFYTLFPQDRLTEEETVRMNLIYPSDRQSPGKRFFSIAMDDNMENLYAAYEDTLLKVGSIVPTRTEIIEAGENFSHISCSDGLLCAVSTKGNLYTGDDFQLYQGQLRVSPFLCHHDGDNIWVFSKDQVEKIPGTSGHDVLKLKVPVSIGAKDNDYGRNAVVVDDDFCYIASGEDLFCSPQKYKKIKGQRMISEHSGQNEHETYAVNELNDLYVIKSGKPSYLKRLKTNNMQDIKGLLGVLDNRLLYYTGSGIYQTSLNIWSGCSKIIPSANGKEMIKAALADPDRRILHAYHDSIFVYDMKFRVSKSLNPQEEFYTSAITMSPDGRKAYIGALNSGLFLTTDFDSPLQHVQSFRNERIESISYIDDRTLDVYTNSSVYRIEMTDGNFVIKDSTETSMSIAANQETYLPELSVLQKIVYWNFPVGLVLIILSAAAIFLLIYTIIWGRIRSRRREKELAVLYQKQETDRRRKEAGKTFESIEKSLSTINSMENISYAQKIHEESCALFKNEQSDVGLLEDMNIMIERWLRLHGRYLYIKKRTAAMSRPLKGLDAPSSVASWNERIIDIENILSELSCTENYETWENGINRAEELFLQMETDTPEFRKQLKKNILDYLGTFETTGSLISEIQALASDALDSIKDWDDEKAMIQTGDFIRQINAFMALKKVEEILESFNKVPLKAKMAFTSDDLDKNSEDYKILDKANKTLKDDIANKFYRMQSDEEMQILYNAFKITRQESVKRDVFISLLFIDDAEGWLDFHLLHGSAGPNNKETNNTRRNEIKRDLKKLDITRYHGSLSLMSMCIQILHNKLLAEESGDSTAPPYLCRT